jgi:penicillin amidase
LITILIVILLPLLGLWFAAQRSLPVLDGVLTINALHRLVTVKFDERSIPFIEASSDLDAYFVQGYVTAAQRMFQMDILRRTAEGKLAGVFGPGSLSHDKLMRTVGIERLAQGELKKLAPPVIGSVQAYSAGVNAYLSTHADKMPLPFLLLAYKPEPWREIDSLAILKYRQYQMDESWQLDDLRQRILDKFGNGGLARELFGSPVQATAEKSLRVPPVPQKSVIESGKKLQPERTSFFKPLAPATFWNTDKQVESLPIWGSNAWAVSGSISETKGALIACDKHSLLSSPDLYHCCTLTAPKLHVSGATIPGIPGILFGRNEHIAWASTDFKTDQQDLVLEQFSPQFPNKYKVSNGWQVVEEIVEDIPVRFANTLLHKVLTTKDGPLLSRNEDSGVALCWASAAQKISSYETIWKLNRAENSQTSQMVLQNYSGSPQSFVLADDQGKIYSHVAGIVNLHARQDLKTSPALGEFGTTINQGWLQSSNWTNCLDYSQLPASQPNESFAVADAPYSLSSSSPHHWIRATNLLNSMVVGSQRIGLPDLALMQIDQTASLSALVKKELDSALKKESIIDGPKLEALAALRKWDGALRVDSVAASIYEAFLHQTARRLLEPKLGQSMMLEYLERWPRWTTFVEQVLINKPQNWLPPEERTYDTFFVTTFSEALKNLKLASREGTNKWQWQNLHQAQFQDALLANNFLYKSILEPLFGIRSIGLGGDADCINACNVTDKISPWTFACNTGPTLRILIDMHDQEKLYVNLVLGQSENLLSASHADQLSEWLKAEPHAIAFSAEQAEKQVQHKLILTDQ